MRYIWYFVITCFLLFVIIEYSIRYPLYLPFWIRYYFKDFLCMPIVFGCCLLILQWIKKDPLYNIPILPIITLSFLYSIYFELILPSFMQRYTADLLDAIMYFFGAFLFYSIQHLEKTN